MDIPINSSTNWSIISFRTFLPSSLFFLFTETGICLKSSSSTKRIKELLFSTFAAISSQQVSRGLACEAAEVAHATRE